MQNRWLERDYPQRFDGGIVFYDGLPVFIATNGDNDAATAYPIIYMPGSREWEKHGNVISMRSSKLSVESPRLGYVNDPLTTQTFYPIRRPIRAWKQALTASSIAWFDPKEDEHYSKATRWDTVIYSQAFEDMLLNKYPTLDAFFRGPYKEWISVAVSRDVALVRDRLGRTNVFYKFELVGYLPENSRTVLVPKTNYAWVVSKYLSGLDWEIE